MAAKKPAPKKMPNGMTHKPGMKHTASMMKPAKKKY